MPIGTLTKRIHCQPSRSVSTPPSSAPAAPPAPPIAPQTPSARLRSGPSAKVVVRIDERGRRDDGAAQALGGAGADEHPLALGEPADQRGEREQQQAAR